MTNVRETRRADELKVGDWLAEDKNGVPLPSEVKAVFEYPDKHGPRVHLTTQTPGRNPFSAFSLNPGSVFELASDAEVDALRQSAERAQKIADIRALADWLEANPEVPLAAYPSEQADLHDGAASVAFVRELGARFDSKVRDDLDDRTQVYIRFGSFEYRVIAWHKDGRPAEAEPQPDADPTGLTYTRADDEPDDPTPVSGPRVPAHTGGVTEGGLAEEVIRYFSFGHGQTDPADDSGKDLVCHYVTVIAPTAEACREAMLASRFGREWAFEYVPGTPQANEWIPRWTEYERIDAMPKPETTEVLVDETEPMTGAAITEACVIRGWGGTCTTHAARHIASGEAPCGCPVYPFAGRGDAADTIVDHRTGCGFELA